jgi:hypothetical protein
MAIWKNDFCDECGREMPILHGIGTEQHGDVLAFCCECCNAGKACGTKCNCNAPVEPDWDGMAEDYWNEKMSDPNY